MAKTPACDMRAAIKYQNKAIRRVALNVNRLTQAKLLEHLESQHNMQRYLFGLVEEDMRRNGIPTDDRVEESEQ